MMVLFCWASLFAGHKGWCGCRRCFSTAGLLHFPMIPCANYPKKIWGAATTVCYFALLSHLEYEAMSVYPRTLGYGRRVKQLTYSLLWHPRFLRVVGACVYNRYQTHFPSKDLGMRLLMHVR